MSTEPHSQRDPTFGDRLQRLMTEKHMTASDLARKVWGTMTDERGYEVPRNRQVIGRYIRGSSYPTYATRQLLSEALGVSYTKLFPKEGFANRPGSGVTLEQLDKKLCHLTLDVRLPISTAMNIIKKVQEAEE